MTKEYKLIVRFFKEVGFYNEFKEYCDHCRHDITDDMPFLENKENPIENLGSTSISHWMECKKGINLKHGNFYDHFRCWLFVFYPSYSQRYDRLSDYFMKHTYDIISNYIDKEKRTMKIEYEKIRKDSFDF